MRLLPPCLSKLPNQTNFGLRCGINLYISAFSSCLPYPTNTKKKDSKEMKLSLKLQDDQNSLLKAKIPISIFSHPFVSSLTTPTPATTNSRSNKYSQNTSFCLSTNFPSGPSLKLSYAPSPSPSNMIPFSLSLKSGLGLFGSPKDSPLIFSAQFSLSSANPGTVIPSFSLHFKPQFGNFSFHKATSSNPSLEPDSGSHSISGTQFQSASPSHSEFGTPDTWQEVKLEPCNGGDDGLETSKIGYGKSLYSNDWFGMERSLVSKDDKKAGIFGGIAVRARTLFPVTKRAVVNLRWAVNLPSDLGSKMPYLTVNKIGIERVEEVKELKEMKNKSIGNNEDDLELVKGIYMSMKRDLEMLENKNREMKQCLEDMRLGVSARNVLRESEGLGRRVSTPFVENSNEFDRWRSKKSVAEDNGGREVKKSANKMSDVESELQKAVKAASS
ncbi:uncharacterized protein LOC111290026 [Durio zibethinus]|uniref:Uncharacterized protein LOC111290026 n=1 Tax=Durio zibethinus TaxID=66656 RepID=A0A6P5Y9T9_DURZI|nr:uncharacterized protein LOC111290026 [Durio zibethinus]